MAQFFAAFAPEGGRGEDHRLNLAEGFCTRVEGKLRFSVQMRGWLAWVRAGTRPGNTLPGRYSRIHLDRVEAPL